MNQEERERLIRIDENMIHIKEWSTKHDLSDDSRFKEVKTQIGWMQKIIFMGIGIVFFIKLFIK